jgi:hypothetical protein
MSKVTELRTDIEDETTRIWETEPDEIRAMRLGVFASGAGSYDQYFSNLVFVNGDMRALSTWITPAVILRTLNDDDFSLEQAKKVFEWTNLVNVDFLAYCGFVKFGEFAHRIVDAYDEIETKEELNELLRAWYAYANRMYMWVHAAFPWGLGVAFPALTPDDVSFMEKGLADRSVEHYFERYAAPRAPEPD